MTRQETQHRYRSRSALWPLLLALTALTRVAGMRNGRPRRASASLPDSYGSVRKPNVASSHMRLRANRGSSQATEEQGQGFVPQSVQRKATVAGSSVGGGSVRAELHRTLTPNKWIKFAPPLGLRRTASPLRELSAAYPNRYAPKAAGCRALKTCFPKWMPVTLEDGNEPR